MPGSPAPTTRPLIARLALLFAMMAILTPFASGQEAPEGASTEAPRPQGIIAIEVESFGVGDVVRPGEWAGVRVVLTDAGGITQPRDIAVRLHVPDPDGDTLLAERTVTFNPGRRNGVWVYAPMPWAVPSFFTVTVHALLDTGAGENAVGRQLAAQRIAPVNVVDADTDLMAVVGPRTLALDQYELNASPSDKYVSHEWIDAVSGLSPEQISDRWEGLLQYRTIVWGDADPTRLTRARADALEEWVRRGGHLVIAMPAVGGVWFTEDDPLRSIMPEATPVRVEDADYEAYRELLTTAVSDDVPLPRRATLHAFERDRGVEPVRATPIIRGPDGVVVTRRLVGTGMVTVVGLDLAQPDLRERFVLAADPFWHRLLGKRFPIPQATRSQRRPPNSERADRQFAGSIENTAQAGTGILLAVVVFALYWLVAGPLGFALLKGKGWQRHAWLGFLVSVALFAFVAWAGANALADRTVRARHLTFLDHVYGLSYQHTRTFAGVMVPGYGDRAISVADGALDGQSRNLVSVWTDPSGVGLGSRFPDARPYSFSMRDPETLESPVRSTVKTVRADWGGGVRWSTPRPSGPGFEPRVTRGNTLTGRLVHDLPAGMLGVKIYLCLGQADGFRRADPEAPARAGVLYPRLREWELAGAWEAGVELDLERITSGPDAGRADTGAVFLDDLTPADNTFGSGFGSTPDAGRPPFRESDLRRDAERLTWLPLLHQPSYADATYQKRRVNRHAGHGLDIARFATMPCVIITGHVRTDEPTTDTATPLRLGGPDGREIPMEGYTVVRWIYPLTPDPVVYPSEERRGG